MSKISILCVAASLIAVAVPACDSGSSSQVGGNTLPASDAGDGNSDDSVAGASGEGGAAGAPSTDFKTTCERLSEVQCKQFYACFSASELAPNAGLVGSSEADCVALFNTQSCTGAACPGAETFNPGNMNKCVANFAALSCNEFRAVANRTAANPPGCLSICQ